MTTGPAGRNEAGFLLEDSRALPGFALFAALWTFALLFVGGLVTSKEAGLSVPDWPLSYGTFNPPNWMQTPNVREEHGHRLIGWGLGVIVILLASWIQARDPRRWMRRLGWAALGLVVVQGVIGGYFRVVLLQHNMAVVHGVLGQGFFCLMVALTLFTSPGWCRGAAPVAWEAAARLHRRSLLAAIALFLQVVLGALVRHSRVGHSVPHVAPHAIFALVVAHLSVGAMVLALDASRAAPGLRTPALLLGGGVILQLMLGLGTYFANTQGFEEHVRPGFQFWTATAHQTAGAVVLAAAVVLHLRSRRFLAVPGTVPAAADDAPGSSPPAGLPAGGAA